MKKRDLRKRIRVVAVAVVLAASGLASGSAGAHTGPALPVVVQGDPAVLAAAVRQAGGQVTTTLDVVGGVVAEVTPPAMEALRRRGLAVTPDVRGTLASENFGPADASATDVQLAALNPGPGWDTSAGAGIGVALVDTGVSDSPDLTGRLVRGPDLSGEGDGVDRYGHGTFMAGLIAGDGPASAGAPIRRLGVAPGAHIVSVKVAGRDGSTSLSRILRAIDWVVVHAEEHNIRVLNLSFGVDTPAAWSADPLSTAVEAAWAAGITVVAAAGNGGKGAVASPGRDPWIITVGASDVHGTATTADDTAPSWSAWEPRGPFSKPDVLAPGVSVVSLRTPGSRLDQENPAARVGDAYFRGSGTSMSTALTSGVAAVLTARHPEAVPDDLKGALVASAQPVEGSAAGAVDLSAADHARSDPAWWQEHPLAGDQASGPQRLPWSLDGSWYSARWYSARWYSARWYSARWYSARWYSARWYGDIWDAAHWTAGWAEDLS